ncbi:MAG: glycosyltransferase [Actinomycetota bacterium]|nr:glycosyltransferase [Actinomycetota bacterium]
MLLVDASDRGGIATYSARLRLVLSEAGVDARLAAPPGLQVGSPALGRHRWGPEFEALSPLRRKSILAGEVASSSAALRRAVTVVEPDLVHFQTEVVPRVDPFVLSWVGRRWPVVITAHDAMPLEGGAAALARSARRWRAADAVVIHGREPLRMVESSAPRTLVRVIPSDLHLGGEPVPAGAARSKLGLREGPLALLLGTLRPYKGLGILAEAWPDVQRAVPEARLAVVGQAYGRFEALDKLTSLEGVDFRQGFIPEEDVDLWAAAADVVLLPYHHGAHSGVLHRAVAMGTPVVGSPPLAEEIHRMGAGAFVPLDGPAWAGAVSSALSEGLPRPQLRDESAMVGATLDLYETVISRRVQGPVGSSS